MIVSNYTEPNPTEKLLLAHLTCVEHPASEVLTRVATRHCKR